MEYFYYVVLGLTLVNSLVLLYVLIAHRKGPKGDPGRPGRDGAVGPMGYMGPPCQGPCCNPNTPSKCGEVANWVCENDRNHPNIMCDGSSKESVYGIRPDPDDYALWRKFHAVNHQEENTLFPYPMKEEIDDNED